MIHDVQYTPYTLYNLPQSLEKSSQGTAACIDAISAIRGIEGDLDTMAMFARTGTLENTGEPFSTHRENILGM